MKTIGIMIVVLLITVGTVWAEAPPSKYYILNNGLSVYIQKRDYIPLVNIVFAVNVGSKDEDQNTNGIVHLLEHLILLGPTQFHTVDEINREMRGHGAKFNAHTSHDLMTFELSLPAQYWQFGLKMIKEKLFHLKLVRELVDKEKEIIAEEISQHHEDPYTLGTFLAIEHLFEGHPYRQPIYGVLPVIEKATIEGIETFYKKYFVPGNSSLAVVGDVDPVPVENKIRQIFQQLGERETSTAPLKTDFKPAVPLKKTVKVQRYLDIKEAHVIFAFEAPPLAHPDQLSLDILKLILGRGLHPLLSRALTKMGKPLAYKIHARYIMMEYGGAFLIYTTLEPKKVNQVRIELIKFLKNLWKFNYSKEDYPLGQDTEVTDYLEAAKSQIKFSHQRFLERGLNAALSYARNILFYQIHKDEIDGKQAPYMKRVDKTTSSDLRNTASRYLSGEKYVMVTILPDNKNGKTVRK
ncbi:MAG: pitrilysin family protein [Candidatus Aminicenantes bacterium]